MREAVILSAVRVPTGKFLGALKGLSATDLGALVVREAVRRAGVEGALVDEVIMGNVVSAGLGQAPARQAALRGGLPPSVAALTINKVCGSGLKAVMLAAQGIASGETDIVVAGGMESMSNAPYLLPKARGGMRLGHGEVLDSMVLDGLWDAYGDYHMGCTGEIVAEKYGITREEQDAYALESHRKAVAAMKEGRFRDEILPVSVSAEEGRAGTLRRRRASSRGHVPRGPRPPQARLQGGRYRHRRELTRRQRRCRSPRRRFRRDGAIARRGTSRPDRRAGRLGSRPVPRDDDSRGGAQEDLVEDGLERGDRRPRRAERGLRRPADRGLPGARPRSGQGERPRRRRRAGAPHRCERRASPHDAPATPCAPETCPGESRPSASEAGTASPWRSSAPEGATRPGRSRVSMNAHGGLE